MAVDEPAVEEQLSNDIGICHTEQSVVRLAVQEQLSYDAEICHTEQSCAWMTFHFNSIHDFVKHISSYE